MTEDLRRVRDDLAVVRRAAGLDPAWDRGAIRTHLLLAAAAAAAAIWTVLPHGLPQVAGLAAFAVPVGDWLSRLRGDTRSAADDREWREAALVLWYVLPLTALALWSRAVGLPLVTTAGIICFMLGFVLFGAAVSERQMRPLLAWAVALMAGGLAFPLMAPHFLAVLTIAIAGGAAAAAAWIAVALRQHAA